MLPKVETKDASSLTNSSVSDLEKTMPKKPFRINSKATIAVSTEDKKVSKDSAKELKPAMRSPLPSQSTTPMTTSKFKLIELDESERENSELSLLANKLLMNRVKEDKVKYQQFLERLGLMKYYDPFWDLGVDSLEGLSKLTVEDYNHLYIPAGIQIKIQLELKKSGMGIESQTKEMALDTNDLPGAALLRTSINETDKPKAAPKLNFGIKMKANKPAATVTMCSMAIETEPVDDKHIPLNVEEDLIQSRPRISPDRPKNSIETSFGPVTKKATKESGQSPRDSTESVTAQSETKTPFSFAAIGDGEWKNCFEELYTGQSGASPGGQFNLGSSYGVTASAGQSFGARTQQTKRVACYCCFRQMEEDEAFDHRHMPGKVGSS